MNLSLQDCIALSDLTEEEVAAIAEHEHIPDIVAAELGNYLVHEPGGSPKLKRMIIDDIESARRRGDLDHCLKLRLVLHHFIKTHPDAIEHGVAPQSSTRNPA
jgi:hypothetical protein